MDKKRLKKLLTTFSLATLLSGAGPTTAGSSSSWGTPTGAGSAEPEKKEAGKTGWSGIQPSAVGTEEKKTDPGKREESGSNPGAGSTQEEKQMAPGKSGSSESKP